MPCRSTVVKSTLNPHQNKLVSPGAWERDRLYASIWHLANRLTPEARSSLGYRTGTFSTFRKKEVWPPDSRVVCVDVGKEKEKNNTKESRKEPPSPELSGSSELVYFATTTLVVYGLRATFIWLIVRPCCANLFSAYYVRASAYCASLVVRILLSLHSGEQRLK